MFVPSSAKRAGGLRSRSRLAEAAPRLLPLAEAFEPRYLFASVADAVAAPREMIDLEPDWHFHRGDVRGASAVSFDDSHWSHVDLPHTWNAQDGQDGGNNYWRGIGWYRKSYDVSEDLAG